MTSLKTSVIQCIIELLNWISLINLKIDLSKTELGNDSTPNISSIHPSFRHLHQLIVSVELLGVNIESTWSMKTLVSRTLSFFLISCSTDKDYTQESDVRRSSAKTLVNSIIVSCLDYCNGMFAGIPV